MEENNLDQVQDETPAEEQPAEGQSEKTEPEDSNLFELPDGRKLAGDQLKEEYLKLNSEFTRRSQELAGYKRAEAETEARNKVEADRAVSENKLLENVDPSVREAIVQIVSPVIQDALRSRDKADEQKRSAEAFDRRLEELVNRYPGGNGLPKFDKAAILQKMQDPANEIYDPEVLYQKMHWDSWMDAQIKAAMKGKSGTAPTETTSTDTPRKPGETKTPKNFAEASKNALGRI